MTNMWIDFSQHDFETDSDTGYLVRTINGNDRGRESYSLRERPLRTNQSNEPRLDGWCGETSNQSRYACGAWRIVQTNRAGDRARIVKLDGEALVVFLRADGYPDLVPDSLRSLSESIGMGEEDGAEAVTDAYNKQGADVVRATLAPGHVGWDESGAAARAHAIRNITAGAEIAAYYRAYARSARTAAERLLKAATATCPEGPGHAFARASAGSNVR